MADRLIGQLLGETYRIDSVLGRGGMGVVYEAHNERIDRKFAVKVLRISREDSPDNFNRFEREARIGSQLGHENIVQVIDFNHTEDDQPYMVMEMLEGQDLASALGDDKQFGLERAANIFRQVCQALDAAHKLKVVHRDLKPENIFLCRKASGGELAKVLDFGISKVMDASTLLTQGSAVMGTPNYMSPEQARGQIDKIDHRSDILAMGTILHQMLTGKLPYPGPDPLSVLYKVIDNELPPLETYRKDLPSGVQEVITRATYKDRNSRYDEVAEMVADLARAMGSRWRDSLMYEVGDSLPGVRLDSFPEMTVQGGDAQNDDRPNDDRPNDGHQSDEYGDEDTPRSVAMAPTMTPQELEEPGTVAAQDGVRRRPAGGHGTDTPDASLGELVGGPAGSGVMEAPSSAATAQRNRRLALGGGLAAVALAAGVVIWAAFGLERVAPQPEGSARPAASRPAGVVATKTGAPTPAPAGHGAGAVEPAPTPASPGAAVPAPTPDGSAATAAAPKPGPAAPGTAPRPMDPPVKLRLLEVLSTPGEAEVWLDDELVGKTPLRGDLLDEGEHVVRLRKKGYAAAKRNIKAGSGPGRLSIRLKPLSASVRVSALVGGKMVKATVYLDGKRVDQTPAALAGIAPGRHQLKLVREGFRPKVRSLNLRPGQKLSLALGLQKE